MSDTETWEDVTNDPTITIVNVSDSRVTWEPVGSVGWVYRCHRGKHIVVASISPLVQKVVGQHNHGYVGELFVDGEEHDKRMIGHTTPWLKWILERKIERIK